MKRSRENAGGTIIIESKIDEDVFTHFAVYDMFVLRKKWIRPLIFFIIMAVFAAVCFIFREGHEKAGMLATVLLAVGIIVPAAYFLTFYISSRDQASKLHLNLITVQYSVELSDSHVIVRNEKENAEFLWKHLLYAVRRKDCIYLYATPKNAYLLPECEDSDEAWNLISEKMPGRISPKKKEK